MSESPIARRVIEGMRRQVRAKVVNLAAMLKGTAMAEMLQRSVVTPKELKAAQRRGEPIIASLREDSIVLAGPEIADLLARRRARAAA